MKLSSQSREILMQLLTLRADVTDEDRKVAIQDLLEEMQQLHHELVAHDYAQMAEAAARQTS